MGVRRELVQRSQKISLILDALRASSGFLRRPAPTERYNHTNDNLTSSVGLQRTIVIISVTERRAADRPQEREGK